MDGLPCLRRDDSRTGLSNTAQYSAWPAQQAGLHFSGKYSKCPARDPRRAVSASLPARNGASGSGRFNDTELAENRRALLRVQAPWLPSFPWTETTGCRLLDLSPDEWIAILLSLVDCCGGDLLVALPFGIAMAWLLARKSFWGKTLLDGAGASAAGAAAGRDRLSAAHHVRPARAPRRLPGRSARHRVLVPLDRSGAGLRGPWDSPASVRPIISVIEATDIRLEEVAATLGANSIRVFLTVTLVARAARGSSPASCSVSPRRSASSAPPSRSWPTFRARRRRSPPPSTRSLKCPTAKRRHGAGGDRDLAHRAGGGRMAVAARRHGASTGNSMLDVRAIEKRLGDFSLSARFQSWNGVTAVFGQPSGAGKTTLVNMMIAGSGRAPTAAGSASTRRVLFDSAKRIDLPPHRQAHRLRLSGGPAVSLSQRQAATSTMGGGCAACRPTRRRRRASSASSTSAKPARAAAPGKLPRAQSVSASPSAALC